MRADSVCQDDHHQLNLDPSVMVKTNNLEDSIVAIRVPIHSSITPSPTSRFRLLWNETTCPYFRLANKNISDKLH